jgi:hypothetical protein
MIRSLLFIIRTWIVRVILENMGLTCIEASMSEYLQFYSKRTNVWKLRKVNIVWSKIRAKGLD